MQYKISAELIPLTQNIRIGTFFHEVNEADQKDELEAVFVLHHVDTFSLLLFEASSILLIDNSYLILAQELKICPAVLTAVI